MWLLEGHHPAGVPVSVGPRSHDPRPSRLLLQLRQHGTPGSRVHRSEGVALIRLLDSLGNWLADRFGARNQLRLGILCVLGSIPLYAYLPFSGEPPIIYVMSALALTLSGMTMVFAAEILMKEEEDE